MDVIFAPDWSDGVPYQRLLASSLREHGVNVRFLYGYKRLLPLSRALQKEKADLLHLHWPEAYFPPRKDRWDWWRRARFRLDLLLALRNIRLATTGHNLAPHNRAHEAFATANVGYAYRCSDIVFAHSDIAKTRLAETFSVPPKRIDVVPHGDLSITLGEPISTHAARETLQLPHEKKIALIFGMVEPYKGQEEIINWWRNANPNALLVIAGKPMNADYREHIRAQIGDAPNIVARFEWLDDTMLRDYLCAADCTIFNYRKIFTSGAANLARSWGLPMILPRRLDTVVFDEPCPLAHRFESIDADFESCLRKALATPPDFKAAAGWRETTDWGHVAGLTLEGYHRAMKGPRPRL